MDADTFSRRVRACQSRLYRVALAIVIQPTDAEDAVQDALVNAWKSLATLRREDFFETWLTRILINRCRELVRKRAAHPMLPLREDHAATTQAAPDMQLRAALDALQERYRLPLVMHCVLDMSVDQVAQALRIPYGAAKWRIHQAKQLVRRYYGEEEGKR